MRAALITSMMLTVPAIIVFGVRPSKQIVEPTCSSCTARQRSYLPKMSED